MSIAVEHLDTADAFERIRSMESRPYVLNQEFEILGAATLDQVAAFYLAREVHEFGDWFIFDSQMSDCIFLTHDNIWGQAVAVV